MRNHEVVTKQPLLKEDGSLTEPGWSKHLVQKYDRRKIRAPKFRIKEWDYYLVLNEDFAGAFTISDDGYIGLQSVSLLNFKEGWEHTETILNAFPMGKFGLPPTSERGDTVYRDKRLHMEYTVEEGKRRIRCKFDDFYMGKMFRCDITLEQRRGRRRRRRFIITRRLTACRPAVRWSLTGRCTASIRKRILGLWTGAGACGPMITAGTGAPAIRW